MQSIQKDQSTPKADISQFRAWEDYTMNELYEIVNRSPLAYYLAFGIVEEAYQNGYKITDPETGEEHPRNTEIQHSPYYHDDFQAFKTAVGNSRTFGAAALRFKMFQDDFEFLNYTSNDVSDNTSFNVDLDDNFNVTRYEFMMNVGTKQARDKVDGKELENVILLINEKGAKLRGRSELEPIFDHLFTETILLMQLSLYVIRVGSGVHRILVDESLFKDNAQAKALFTDLKEQLDKMGLHTKLIFPKMINGVETSYELYHGEGNPISWQEAHNVILTPIAAKTGIPLEKLRGESTAFASTDVHQRQFYSLLVKLEEKHKKYHKLQHKIRYGMELESFDIQYNEFAEMSESEKAKSNLEKIQALAGLSGKLKEFGISPESLLEFLKIDIEIDQGLLEEHKQASEQMRSLFAQNTDKSNEKDTEGQQDT